MQRLLLLLIALLLLASQAAFAKGPQKLEVEEYDDIDAAPDAAWGKTKNLNDLNEPHPAVETAVDTMIGVYAVGLESRKNLVEGK